MRMEINKEEAELILFRRKQQKDADRLSTEKQLKIKNCIHDFKYDGHGHNYSVYKCVRCGQEEER